MTGFGRASASVEKTSLLVEVRTLNHRHADVQVRTPRAFSDLEAPLRRLAKERFGRGKIDLSVTYAQDNLSDSVVTIDRVAVAQYVAAANELSEEHDLSGTLSAEVLLTLPGVSKLAENRVDDEAQNAAVLEAAAEALAAAEVMRRSEGENLEKELRQSLRKVAELVTQLESRSGLVVDSARERLRKRAESLRDETGLLDEARLHQEIVLAADRMDIREELVRLHSHLEVFEAAFDSEEPVGRRLDFLLQEMGREANTVGSKASDAPLAHLVVDLKTELERIREQAQNIE